VFLTLLQSGPPAVFRLFGVLFAVLGLLNVVKPREMTAYQIRRRTYGAVDGRIEPTETRLWVTRVIGVVMVAVGIGLASGSGLF